MRCTVMESVIGTGGQSSLLIVTDKQTVCDRDSGRGKPPVARLRGSIRAGGAALGYNFRPHLRAANSRRTQLVAYNNFCGYASHRYVTIATQLPFRHLLNLSSNTPTF